MSLFKRCSVISSMASMLLSLTLWVVPSESLASTELPPAVPSTRQGWYPTPSPTKMEPAMEGSTIEDERSMFQATVVMSVSSDILLATEEQVMEFSQAFLTAWNRWEDNNPDVCDPLLRVLTSVTNIQTGFVYSRRQRQRRQLDSINVTEYSNSSNGSRQHRDMQEEEENEEEQEPPSSSSTPALINLDHRVPFVDFLLGFDGSCNQCGDNDPLFADDVSNRFLQMESVGEVVPECSGTEFRAPTEQECLNLFLEEIDELEFVTDVVSLKQVYSQPCPAPTNDFDSGTEGESFVLDVSPFLERPSRFDSGWQAFSNALVEFTNPDVLLEYYVEFQQGYCDPLFRKVDSAEFVVANVEDAQTTLTMFGLDGECRGCSSLFDDRRRHQMLRRMDDHHGKRMLQTEELCWCNWDSAPQAPTRQEFETFLSNKFLEVASGS
mmetsp:Transcript_26187/g.48839  ORF Transcript_26187/g.48839 Transcript_26187/m.48839 type:complete len:437 (-) Transcript_26187:6-1316(-)